MFVPLTKYDAERNIATGVIAAEELDKSGEILDFEKSLPHFQAWSDEFKKATDGKNVGNLRVMHTAKVAGRGIEFVPVADKKRFEMAFHVVDRDEQEKCATGCYTGFSIGGAYVKRWDDPAIKFGEAAAKRYEARPAEVSLVDNPCIPSAQFEYLRAAGVEPELRKFKAEGRLAKVKALDESLKKLAELMKGDVPAEAAAPARAAIEGIEEVKAKLQEVLSNFALLPPDRTTWDMHELVDALSQINWAAYTARDVLASASIAAPESIAAAVDPAKGAAPLKKEGEGETPAPVDPAPADPKPADPAPAVDDPQAPATPAAPADSGAAETGKAVLNALNSQATLTKALTDQVAALKDGVAETVRKTVDDAVQKAKAEADSAVKALESRLTAVEATPAAIGTPVRRVEKTLGTEPGEPHPPTSSDALKVAQDVLMKLKPNLSEAAYREVTLQMAASAMPR